MTNPFAGWKTKAEIVEELGVSERTLERMLQKNKVRRGQKRIPGRKPITVISPEDVARLRAEMVQPEPDTDTLPAVRPPTLPQTRLSQYALEAVELYRNGERIPFLPLFLPIKAASRYAGLSEDFLRQLIRERKIRALQRGAYFIAREELERFAKQYVGAE